MRWALAEFADGESLVAAARALRGAGYRALEAFSPYPVHGLEEALALRRSRLPWLVFALGFGGAGLAFLIQWFCDAWDYPLDVGGRPAFAIPAFVPITFEMGVLAAAFAGLLGLLRACRLPRLAHPIFEVPGFERATIDRFWIGVAASDARWNEDDVRRDLERLAPLRVLVAEA